MIETAEAIHAAAKTGNSGEKETNLRRLMREMKSVLVAYSGGIDSAYLAVIATQELGLKAVCMMGLSPSVSEFQRTQAQGIAADHGLNFETVATREVEDPRYAANPSNRCYFCKSELYSILTTEASQRRLDFIVDGMNADDAMDHRPGTLAATEQSVRSPLAEIGFTKDEIRQQSRALGLTTWDKPASPCLSSRIAHGVPVTIERLEKVERGEEFLRSEGFREFRVRVHGDLVRIEISPDEIALALTEEMADRFSRAFKSFGFRFITLDLTGFRSGSMSQTTEQ